MTYSVWNYATRQFDYYKAGELEGTHAGTPPVRVNSPEIGITPEQLAWQLPADAVKIGSGTVAQGRVASSGGPAEIPNWLIYGVAAYAAWRLFR